MALDSSALELYGKPIFTIDGVDDDLLFEQVIDFSGGEDDYRRSTLIGQNQCQKLTNVIVRDNYEAWTRPGADPFAPQVVPGDAVETLVYFDTPTNKFILSICNGVLRSCSGQNQAWNAAFTSSTTIGGVSGACTSGATSYTAANTNTQVEICQGVDTVLISDGTNAMAMLDGSLNLGICATTSADPPKGANILCWCAGRMFAAGFTAAIPGDTIQFSNLLSIGDGQWDTTAKSFRVGAGDGDRITALFAMQSNTLAVFKQNSVWLVNVNPITPATPILYSGGSAGTAGSLPNLPVTNSGWQSSGLIQSVGYGVGCVGKRAVCAVGNDVFFMAQDGVRTVQRMQAAAGQWQLSAPLSQPVHKYIEQINTSLAAGIVATTYKEFVFFAIPVGSSATGNNTTLVYNTRLGSWLGAWTNWTPSSWCESRFNSVEQLLFGDTSGYVNYWKDAASTTLPSTYTDNGIAIATTIWTRSFQFLQAVNDKFPYNCTLRFTAGSGTVNIAAVMDLAQALTWQSQIQPSGDILGQHILGPFRLASVKPSKTEKSLRSCPAFNEMFLNITLSSGYMQLRNITVAAFLKALDN